MSQPFADSAILAVSRRSALRMLGGGAALAVLSACAPIAPAPKPTTATSPASTQPAAGAQAQAKTGGVLKIADSDPQRLDGHLILTNGINITWMPYDRLIQYDDKLQPQPALAESFELAADARQIKFNLRKGVQFHSGREFTSEDVKWNLLRVRDPKTGVAQLATQSAWFTDIQTPDKYTVLLKTDQPRPFVFDLFEYLNILDQQTKEGPDADTKLIGTGPFVWEDYRQGQSVRLAKNKNYWRSGRPYLDAVEIQFMTDQQAAVIALESGGVDVVAPPARDAARLRQDTRYRFLANEQSGRHYLLAVNTTMAPGNDKVVRQALSFALDRKRIADQVLLGLGAQPRSLPWSTTSAAYDQAKDAHYAFDPDKARALLGGRTVEVEITVNSTTQDTVSMAQIYQADLEKSGFKPTIKSMEGPAILQYADMQKNPGVWINQSGYSHLGPQALCTISRHWNIGANASGFVSEPYRQLVNSIATEPDAAKRKTLYAQLNDFLLDEQFVITVASNAEYVVTRATVQGFHFDGHGARAYSDVWLA